MLLKFMIRISFVCKMNTDWIVEVCLCDRYPSSARAMRDTQNNQKADEHLKSSLTLVQCTSDGVKTSGKVLKLGPLNRCQLSQLPVDGTTPVFSFY